MSDAPKPFDREIIDLLTKAILEDEFDDRFQNEDIYGAKISGEDCLLDVLKRLSGWKELSPLAYVGCGSSLLPVSLETVYYVDPNPKRLRNVPVGEAYKVNAWAENLPTDRLFDLAGVVCWGTWCFLRSHAEAMVSFNRVLRRGGVLIFDFPIRFTLPTALCFEENSLLAWSRCFGFELIERGEAFKDETSHRRYFVLEKVRDFDPRWLRLPQCKGEVLNYLPERDFYLR